MLPGCQHAWLSPCPAWQRVPFWKTPLPSDENPPTLWDLTDGAGDLLSNPAGLDVHKGVGPLGRGDFLHKGR